MMNTITRFVGVYWSLSFGLEFLKTSLVTHQFIEQNSIDCDNLQLKGDCEAQKLEIEKAEYTIHIIFRVVQVFFGIAYMALLTSHMDIDRFVERVEDNIEMINKAMPN